MEKIIKFLPVMAILLASGLAVATTKKVNAPNVYWNGTSWQQLTHQPGDYTCPGTGWCTGYWDGDEVLDIEDGIFTPRPNL
jgi:hypothetical protein